MKRAIAFIILAVGLAACAPVTQSIKNDQVQTDRQLQQYQTVQPVPFYDWSQDRAALIQIYTAKNEQRQTYTVITSQGTGAALFACPSIGFPIPADTQLTNPDQIAFTSASGVGYIDGVVGQMEPNGTYSSGNTDATYVLCIRPDGKVSPVYTEQKVSLFPFPVAIEGGVIVDAGGETTITVDLTKPGDVPVVSASPQP